MSDELAGLPAGEAVSYPVDSMEPMSFEDAVRDLGSAREKAQNPPAESAPEKVATAEPELPVEGDAGPEEVPSETQEADPEEQLPPIERPRSWSKDDDDDWNALPRDRQEKIAKSERAREADINRKINEAAEKLKGLTAKEQEVEKVRQQYESKIKTASEVLEREQLRDFPDIRTMADVERMALEDPFRKIQWDVHQQKMQAVAWEAQQSEQRKANEHQTEWTKHVQSENALAAELIPELADKVKGPALMNRAAERLAELGFKQEELNDLANGKSKLSIYDHRFQQLVFSDLKLADIQKATKAVAAKPVPAVVRPGTAKPVTADSAERIKTLERQLSSASGDQAARISAAIWALERKSASRR